VIVASIGVNDGLTPALKAAAGQISPARCAKIAARLAADVFISHFENLSRERHRSQMPHDFYLTAARSTIGRSEGSSAIVEVSAPTGLRQRVMGGKIYATKSYSLRGGRTYSALWIPVGEAVGRTGGDYRGALAVIWNSTTQKGVALDKSTRAVLFALVPSVDQEPDPSVMPSDFDLRSAVIPVLCEKLAKAWQRQRPED
jgi:hypothetical protein